MKTHKKINKKDASFLQENLKKLEKAYNQTINFNLILFEEILGLQTQHGNFGGNSRIRSIGARFSFTEEDLVPPYNAQRILLELTPKLFIRYQCSDGIGDLIFKYDQIKLDSEKQLIRIDFILSCNPGYPSHITVKDKNSFNKIKRALRNSYRAAGFKQKGILI